MSSITSLIIVAGIAVATFLVFRFTRSGTDTPVTNSPNENIRDDDDIE